MLLFLKILVLVFGLFELTTNITYLSKKNGIRLAYNQHKEIPATVTEGCMHVKVITMLFVGIMFLSAGVYVFIVPTAAKTAITAVFAVYCVYTWGEALYYRYLMSFVLAGIITMLMALSYFIA